MAPDVDRSLFVAAVAGDKAGVDAALAGGADPSKVEQASRMDPLGWAVRMGNSDCVASLLAAGADPWRCGPGEGIDSAVAVAVAYGQWDILAQLADGCLQRSMMTPESLMRECWGAAERGRHEAMPVFARMGVDLDSLGKGDHGPLSTQAEEPIQEPLAAVAIRHEDEQLLRTLLDLGADPDLCWVDEGKRPRSPGPMGKLSTLALKALRASWPEGLILLLKSGKDVEDESKMHELAREIPRMKDGADIMFEALRAAGADFAGPGPGRGGLLLGNAVGLRSVKAVAWLCEDGVDFKAAMLSSGDKSALDRAFERPTDPAAAWLIGFARAQEERASMIDALAAEPAPPRSKKARM